ncbi:MAG: ATP-binding protein [Pirellula sp.]|jgi:DNA topoisomerase-6 subunit B
MANPPTKSRRATAESMATKQRDVSVSEFFAKNRHLLGFDNPRKALLTTVKEAVDNSLDACEEAGILPEVWVRIDQPAPGRFRVAVQDNGPGIVKKQIPLIFGKLLYGSKFHRLRMSRGQQGIGISAAGMNGMLTTGRPMQILSKTSKKSPVHYFLLQVDTKKNQPEIINGKGEGIDIPTGEKGLAYMRDQDIVWETHYPGEDGKPGPELESGTRVTIELTAVFKRSRGSVDEYLEQTAIANPHVTIHWQSPDGEQRTLPRTTTELPREAKEIKPHPYGVELGRLITMLGEDKSVSLSSFLTNSFSCVTPAVAKKVCEAAKLSTRASAIKVGQTEAERLYTALQETKIRPPSTDCIVPIGRELLYAGLKSIVPGEFHDATTRPPSVHRGSPFQVEVALAYGGGTITQKLTREELVELIQQSDARTLRKFLIDTFAGIGSDSAEKIIEETKLPTRCSPQKLKKEQIDTLHSVLREINISEGQSMQIYRFANRVPLQYQQGACAITQAVMGTNWRSYGLSQSKGSLPSGPITLIVHVASVWVPFTSESKEAIANAPEIEKELRLGIQAIGRSLAAFLRKRQAIAAQGNRRNVFLRYLREVAGAVATIQKSDATPIYEDLLHVAKRKTATADVKLDEFGQEIVEEVVK